ncbi:hypothetical protein [Oceanisphaera sp. W20_SRM_FM3]|uniref:hypothetical protein n=1 Tax=Oceanisphaera sp. W20_SRM_FM3 TaxID=3240267 RepID=UPI003F951ECB
MKHDRGVKSGLLMAVCGLLLACGEPESINEYIANAAKQQGASAEPLLPLVTVSVPPTQALSYQAQDARNPFFWQRETFLSDELLASRSLNGSNPKIMSDADLHSTPPEECEVKMLPELVLRATFSDHSFNDRSARGMALIQVAGGAIYPVTLGQRLIASRQGLTASDQSGGNDDLGEVTAISAQTVTLKQNPLGRQHCPGAQHTILRLYE